MVVVICVMLAGVFICDIFSMYFQHKTDIEVRNIKNHLK